MSNQSKPAKPRILIVTPEITYLPSGMGNMAQRMSAKAGGLADVSASLVSALFELGADVGICQTAMAETGLCAADLPPGIEAHGITAFLAGREDWQLLIV